MSQTDERRPGGTGRRSEKAGQVASVDHSTGRRGHSPTVTLAALSAALRDYGIAKANENADPWWRSCCDRAIDYLAACGEPFSADHVQALIPAADHPCRIGARFHAAVHAGVVRPVGYVLSERPSRHRGVLRLYRGGAAR